MNVFETQEELILWLIHFFSQRFKNHAILKGGMILRLLESPRYTNDADFIFIPYHSKKDLAKEIQSELSTVDGMEFQTTINSKAIRILIQFKNQKAQVEVNIDQECASIPVSTADFARKNKQLPQVIRVMDYSVALAHKLAAWNERRLIRDLYDTWYLFKIVGVTPDEKTLKRRLQKVESRRKRIKGSMSLKQFMTAFDSGVQKLSQKKIEEEMNGLLHRDEMVGICEKLKSGLRILSNQLKQIPE